MKRMLSSLIPGLLSMALGLAVGNFARREWPQSISSLGSQPLNGDGAGGFQEAKDNQSLPVGFSPAISLRDAIQKHPDLVLQDLGKWPFLEFTEADCVALAGRIDLDSQKQRMLLNQVSNPELRKMLWAACVRKNVSTMPPATLVGYLQETHAEEELYEPIIGKMIAKGKTPAETFTGGLEKALLPLYLKKLAAETLSLEEAMKPIPVTDQESRKLRAGLAADWIGAHPDVQSLKSLLKVSRSLGNNADVQAQAAATVWQASDPAARQEVIRTLSSLPDIERNRALSFLPAYLESADAESMSAILGGMSSVDCQADVAEEWLKEASQEDRALFIKQLAEGPGKESFKKLQERLPALQGSAGK